MSTQPSGDETVRPLSAISTYLQPVVGSRIASAFGGTDAGLRDRRPLAASASSFVF